MYKKQCLNYKVNKTIFIKLSKIKFITKIANLRNP